MDNETRRFFVIGYPRSRTAWLSVLLNGNGVRCEHEASGGRGFEGVKDAFLSWGPGYAAKGTADAGLLFNVEECMAWYPDARWVIIMRDSRQALCAMMADRPSEAASWKEKWPAIEAAFNAVMKALEGRALLVFYNEIDSAAERIYKFCTGRECPVGKAESLRGLRITQILPRSAALPGIVRQSAVERLAEAGIDLDGLTVRRFEPGQDMLRFAEWGNERGLEGSRLAPLLPPLGVVIEDGNGPAGMLFCRESYGAPVAELEYSVTRPGLSLKESAAVMGFAVAACIELAGKLVVPQAVYSIFRVTCRPSLGRFVERLGFVPHGPDSCQKYIYQKS